MRQNVRVNTPSFTTAIQLWLIARRFGCNHSKKSFKTIFFWNSELKKHDRKESFCKICLLELQNNVEQAQAMIDRLEQAGSPE